MTPRDRIRMAMELQHPDRVPLMCQFSFGFINQQLKDSGISPMEMWLDAHKYFEGLLILRNWFNFDGILISVHGHYENWRSRIEKTETVNGLEVATFADKRETYPDNDLPSATFFNKGLADISTIGIDKLPAEIEFIPASKDCHWFIDMNNPFRVFDLLDEKVKENIPSTEK